MNVNTATIKDWKQIKIGDICTIVNGFAFKSNDYAQDGYHLIRIQNVQDGYIVTTNDRFIPEQKLSGLDRFKLQVGDLLMSLTGQVGRVGIIKPSDIPAVLNQRVAKVIPSNEIDREFLFFLFRFPSVLEEIKNNAFGAIQKNVSTKSILNITVTIPPLPEQQTIAAILSKIQEAIENQDKIIKTTTELKKSLMKKIFSEGLNGEPLKQTEIGKIPKSWEVRRISEVFKFTSKPRQLKQNGKIPFIPMELIPIGELYVRDYISKDKVTSGTYIENGDLLIAKITPSFENGKQAIAQIDFNFAYATTEVIPVKGIEGVSSNKYLYYYLLIQNVRTVLAGKMEGSTGRQRLSKSILEETLIPMPKLDEQHRITDIFESLDKKIDFARRKKTIFTDLFKSMLNNLMSGKIRVNNLKL